jgi:hypothetical protein
MVIFLAILELENGVIATSKYLNTYLLSKADDIILLHNDKEYPYFS